MCGARMGNDLLWVTMTLRHPPYAASWLTKRVLLNLILCALLVVFVYTRLIFLSTTYKPTFESSEMEKGAASLAKFGMLGNVFASDSGISAHLVPVYVFLLGIVYKICGVDTPAAWMSKGVMAVVFSGAAIFLLAWLARRAKLTPVVGLAAVSFLVLGKKQIWQETRGDWDHTFTALLLILTILLALNLQDDRWSSWRGTAAWGLTMGFGALLNPAITLPTGAIVMMSHFLAFAADRRRLLVQFTIAASAAACVIAPWTYRNYRAFHAFVPLRSNFGLELCLGNSPRADGTTFATNKTDHPHVNPIQLQLYKEMGEIRYMKLKQDEAMQWIKANPRRFAILTGRRVLMFWFGDTIAKTDWSSKGLRDKFLGCLLGIGACSGLTWLAVIRHPYRWTFFAAMVGPMTIFAFTHVYDRYRYPIDGLQLLLSLEFVSVVLVAIAQRLHGPSEKLGTV